MNNKLRKLVIYLAMLSIFIPIIILTIWGFTSSWVYPRLIPGEYSLRGVEYILNKENLIILIDSLIISIIVSLITILISIPAAHSLIIYNFKGKKLIELLILSPIIIPLISVAMGIHITFLKLNIANTLLGVIIINIIPCIPYAVRILSDTYQIVGNKFEIQAKTLGANKKYVFMKITLPLLAPGIMSAFSMCFIISFSQYFLTMLIGGGRIITYPMVMFPYVQSGDRLLSSLYSVVFIAISLIVLFIMQSIVNKFFKSKIKLID
ncbi:ABC transporter permease [Romboutsia lituseburensis]|uniref:ABC transporter permease n=1 Tax=Romboutsia lituseburensis TaxID=1537 RepID=UPI00215B72A9|nr:ABC transporter permease subunit [Romboutsia lituseburensis]MCR8746335.1 ABC transporter permease subunit [Romboutsia lituseburensis]